MGKSGQLLQVYEFRIMWNKIFLHATKIDKRIAKPKEEMPTRDFLSFLKEAATLLTLQLVSMNAIILKEPGHDNEVLINSLKENGKLIGAEYRSSHDKNDCIIV